MFKKLFSLTVIMLLAVINLTYAATFEEVKSQAEQAGLEITWIDTDITNFMTYSFMDYKGTDDRYVVNYIKDNKVLNIVINKLTGEVIPTALYDEINNYSEGRAAVNYQSSIYEEAGANTYTYFKYGFIDTEGNEVVPTIYDYADNFSEGLAVVKINWMYGYIDYNGNVVLPLEYTWASSFSGGYATVQKTDKNSKNTMGIIDKKGNFTEVKDMTGMTGFKNGIARAWNWNKEIYVDVNGNEVKNVQEARPEILNNYDYASNFKEGRSVVTDYAEQSWQNKIGVIDEEGNVIIPMLYSSINDYSEGMAAVQLAHGNYAYFDIDGNKITPFKYNIANDFHEGAAIVGLGDYRGGGNLAMGAVNKYGNEIVPLIFNQISNFYNGFALVGVERGSYQSNTSNKLGILKLPETVNADNGINNMITVTLDGKELAFDQDPIMSSNRVLAPIRPILEAMGAELTWNNGNVTVIKGDTKIELQIRNNEAFVNGKSYILDVPVNLVSGRTLAPVRFIAQCFNYDVDWNKETKTVIISQK